MSDSVPAPIDVQPSGQLQGIDGPWSTFPIRVGTPAQIVNVLVSTLISETWVVRPQGCTSKSPFGNCASLRGGIFDNTTSDTWDLISNGAEYSLVFEQALLGDAAGSDGGSYGHEMLGINATSGAGIVLEDQVVAGITTNDYFLGMLGVAEKTPTIAGQTKPSFLRSLLDNKQIPSLSYSYTAGASYRDQLGSLTFGGQDTSRFEPNNVNFTMADDTRDLSVGLQSITVDNQGDSVSLLTDGIMSFIDSTLPYIWIPTADCDKWADAFGLQFNEATLMYNLNATQHQKNLDANATITFELGTAVEGGDTAKISFPYSAFDLNFTNPSSSTLQDPVFYFPLRQADRNNQFVLGRAFLQNAYLSVNYEWSNFSIYHAVPGQSGSTHIVPLPAFSIEAANNQPPPASGTNPTSPNSSSSPTITHSSGGGFPKGAIAGIVIAVLALALGIFAFFCIRKRRRSRRAIQPSPVPPTPNVPELKGTPEHAFYTAVPTKTPPPQNDYFAQTRTAPKNPTAAAATELPSPPPQFSSTLGTPSAGGTPHSHAHELAGNDVSHELPSRQGSVSQLAKGTMSQGPSPSLNPTVPVQRAGASPEPWAGPSMTEYAAATSRPSLLSASSVNLASVSGARIISHTRAGSSLGSGKGGMSPSALGSGVAGEEGVHGGHVTREHQGENGNGSGAEEGLKRGGSHRSQASEGTLVNPPTEAGQSPDMRAVSPDARGRDGEEDHGTLSLSAFTSPVLGAGIGFEGARERNERLERERMVSPEPLTPP
ncbi:MAG: hypothetical protein MMC23_001110 [Stictis urceolatum]|nr:hypothetical protein [Stictis urceolata]